MGKTELSVDRLIEGDGKLLLDSYNNEELTNNNLETLKDLYITLKALDENLKFLLLT